MEKENFVSELIEKSNEVMTSIHCFREAGVSALREMIREQIEGLDWSGCYLMIVLKELEERLGETQDALSDSDFDLYPYEIGEAVDKAVKALNNKIEYIDSKGNVIGYEPIPYSDIAVVLMSIFNEYLETYYVK